MTATPHRHPNLSRTVEVRAGQRVAFDGRIWVIEAVAAREVALKAASSPGLDVADDDARVVDTRTFIEGLETQEALVLDRATASRAKMLRSDDWVRWSARIKVVNLLDTGYSTGHPDLEDEPLIPLLTSGGLSGRRARRILHDFLASDAPAARELCHDLNARHRRESGEGKNLKFDAPGESTIDTWARNFHRDGPAGLLDLRSESRIGKGKHAERRRATECLVDEVLSQRTAATSQHSDEWVAKRVRELADQRFIRILEKSALREVIRGKHSRAGRSPSQAETKRQDTRRTGRSVSRPIVPGATQAWDATVGDVLVTLVPGGVPFRAHVHVCVDAATGVVTSAFATGRYSAANVLLLAFDAFRPMTLLPLPGGGVSARLKNPVETIYLGKDIQRSLFKPGAIARRVRTDNAKQNYAHPTLATMRYFEVDMVPSQVGVKTQNTHAENAIGIAANLLEDFPAYVGKNTTARGRNVEEGDEPMLLEEFNAMLQQALLIDHNSSPCTAPAFRNTGLSRLDAWDELINAFGALPMLTQPHEYLQFLPSRRVCRGRNGLALERERFDDRTLWEIPPHLVDSTGRVEVIFDPRRLEQVWLPDRREQRFHVVRNVLCDYMNGPLVAHVRDEALKRSGLRDRNSAHRRAAFTRYAEQVLEETGQNVGIDRDLADWVHSNAKFQESLRRAPHDMFVTAQSGSLTGTPATLPGNDLGPRQAQRGIDLDRPLALPGRRS